MTVPKTIILVTGSNQGIGFDTVAALVTASPNYHVILSSRSADKGKKAISEIQARKPVGTVSYLQLDVTNSDSIAAAVKSVEADFGRLDVLVNNAGIVDQNPDLATQLRNTFETNVIGATVVAYSFVPLLQKSSDPRIIHVSSGLGSIALADDPTFPFYNVPAGAYRMSKAALDMMGVTTQKEFSKWGCKSWVLCPGYVVTNLTGEEDREDRIKNGALSSETSADTIKRVIGGERDADVGKFVHKDGVYPW